MGLGPVAGVGLQKAREKARAARELLAEGIDPIDHKRRSLAVPSFGDLAEDQPLVDGVHDLTAGSPGKTFRLLNAAAVHAIDAGEEQITLKTLRLDDVTRHVRTAAAMRRRVRAAAG
jgi:hypothetical protein